MVRSHNIHADGCHCPLCEDFRHRWAEEEKVRRRSWQEESLEKLLNGRAAVAAKASYAAILAGLIHLYVDVLTGGSGLGPSLLLGFGAVMFALAVYITSSPNRERTRYAITRRSLKGLKQRTLAEARRFTTQSGERDGT